MGDYEPQCSGFKTCTHCHKEKHILCFAVNKRALDGCDSWCRRCQTDRQQVTNRANAFERKTATARGGQSRAAVREVNQHLRDAERAIEGVGL